MTFLHHPSKEFTVSYIPLSYFILTEIQLKTKLKANVLQRATLQGRLEPRLILNVRLQLYTSFHLNGLIKLP